MDTLLLFVTFEYWESTSLKRHCKETAEVWLFNLTLVLILASDDRGHDPYLHAALVGPQDEALLRTSLIKGPQVKAM